LCYEVRFDGSLYKLFSANIKTVEHRTTSTLSHDFIIEQIDKCEEKLSGGDYDGAITNARSLIEAVSISLVETTIIKRKYFFLGLDFQRRLIIIRCYQNCPSW
jgi:hypothetical protein